MADKFLIDKAKRVLNQNYQKKGFTIPSKNLYPFQWKWDSGFIAIGFAHFDIEKAKKEINSLLNAQWKNGFIPHIVFHTKNDSYFPGADFHKSSLHPKSPVHIDTSGITQPPVLGFVLEKLYNIADDKEDVLNFLKNQIDKVYKNHEYFYSKRDINNEGLVYIYHNWESGTDNSPVWDEIWKTMNPPRYKFERKDTTHVDSSQRPTDREYDHYIDIIELAKKFNYDDHKIAKHSPFLIQDPLFNSILIKSNESLIRLYKILGGNEEKIKYLKSKNEKSLTSINEKLYNSSIGAYLHFDLRNKKNIPLVSSSSFSPLFCGAPNFKIAKRLKSTLVEKFGKEDYYLCSSFDPEGIQHDPKKYWRGPVWINLNWILYNGLKRYKFKETAKRIKNDSLELVDKLGFYEYFNPSKKNSENNKGYGGENFSWSAALTIDFLSEK